MKLIHLSDLHLGKRVHEFSMLADQAYILEQILTILAAEQPHAVLIAGDVYDKSVPPAEAVGLFDRFLCRLADLALPVFIISGNHDSPERLAFGGRLMAQCRVYMAPVYDGTVTPITLEDQFGPVDFYLLPFVKPAHVRRFCPEAEIGSYTDALAVALEQMAPDRSRRNVLLTHQFVTGAARSESEELCVGGCDNVDAAVFADFDYVALGHIHGPQWVGRETIRYCGTPLKYSFSEADHRKSLTVAELGEKGSVSIRTIPLTPLHDMRVLRGTYEALTDRRNYQGTATDDYLHITLTDETEILDAVQKLRVIYPNLMKLDYDNSRTRAALSPALPGPVRPQDPLDLFRTFYQTRSGAPMTQEQEDFVRQLLEEIQEACL